MNTYVLEREGVYINIDNCTNKHVEGTKGNGHVDIYVVYRGDMQDLTSHVILKVLKIAIGCFSICTPPPPPPPKK